MLLKDDAEHPVPEQWRPMFREIADAFVDGDYLLREHHIEAVAPVAPVIADHIAANIAGYGDRLAPLNEATWDRSVYRWMDGSWEVLVDLSTESEPVSDLTLHARRTEADGASWEIDSVHVP